MHSNGEFTITRLIDKIDLLHTSKGGKRLSNSKDEPRQIATVTTT